MLGLVNRKTRTVNDLIASEAAEKLQAEGYSLAQATEHLSWWAALWDDDLPDLARAYRAEMRNLPARYNTETR